MCYLSGVHNPPFVRRFFCVNAFRCESCGSQPKFTKFVDTSCKPEEGIGTDIIHPYRSKWTFGRQQLQNLGGEIPKELVRGHIELKDVSFSRFAWKDCLHPPPQIDEKNEEPPLELPKPPKWMVQWERPSSSIRKSIVYQVLNCSSFGATGPNTTDASGKSPKARFFVRANIRDVTQAFNKRLRLPNCQCVRMWTACFQRDFNGACAVTSENT